MVAVAGGGNSRAVGDATEIRTLPSGDRVDRHYTGCSGSSSLVWSDFGRVRDAVLHGRHPERGLLPFLLV
jgi:hypothetical protein